MLQVRGLDVVLKSSRDGSEHYQARALEVIVSHLDSSVLRLIN